MKASTTQPDDGGEAYPRANSKDNAEGAANPEIWGGIECTVNRVGDRFFDQLVRNGHHQRLSDLQLIREIGIRTLRYPILWERTAPISLDQPNWEWADERLYALRNLGIRPIVGLLHHGSGPAYTSLLDPAFPEKLAAFARLVAQRYPWLDAFTPVNEPLTTARFSGHYGHWYPHGRVPAIWAQTLLHQCRGVAQAMAAIREIIPGAQLVQTEDLGKVFSTAKLAYQADFENERRWISLDLLTGRVVPRTWMWEYLTFLGVPEEEIAWFADHPCLPDILGMNYYVTSERYLDHRLSLYPPQTHGGNGRDCYADVEAVRVQDLAGPETLLSEMWKRYGIPIAITEAHIGCYREEQIRWFVGIWRAAVSARRKGVPVTAVTAWSLLGSFDWDNLLTRENGSYEAGAVDVSGGAPRLTGLGRAIQALVETGECRHPVLATPGWWQRPGRHIWKKTPTNDTDPPANVAGLQGQRTPFQFHQSPSDPLHLYPSARPILITGATGTLGRAFSRICERRGVCYRLVSRKEMDITNPQSIETLLSETQPWAVINTAGYVKVGLAEAEKQTCFRANVVGPVALAAAAQRRGLPFLTYSSDLIFDGQKQSLYLESDPTAPLGVYGETKAQAEEAVLAVYPQALIIRTAAFFGPWDEYNFVTVALRELARGRPFRAPNDSIIAPTYVPDLVNASLNLVVDGASGIWHVANQGAVSWFEFAAQSAAQANVSARRLIGEPTAAFGFTARRPSYSALGTERGLVMPTLEDALARYVSDCESCWQSAARPGTVSKKSLAGNAPAGRPVAA